MNRWVLVLVAVLVVAGSVGCPSRGGVVPILYVANGGSDSLVGFTFPAALGGNREPEVTVEGDQTGLAEVTDIAVDRLGNVYALNDAAATITVYRNPRRDSGNVAPAREALLGSVAFAYSGMAFGPWEKTLRVMFTPTNQTLLFPDPTSDSFHGAVSALALSVTLTALEDPVAIHERDRLYIADAGRNAVFHATLDGATAIECDAFADIRDVFVDKDDVMYVVNGAEGGNTVVMLAGAGGLEGEVEADGILAVPGADDLAGIVVGADGTGYLADEGANAVYVYVDLAERSGPVFPDRTLRGGSTGLDAPRRLALYER